VQYVPVRFAKKHLVGRPFVSLHTCDGKQWHARCSHFCASRSTCYITDGWNEFRRDNNLEEGDVRVFQLIERNPVVLYVSIFHVSG
jgi:hypothetical protein